MSRRFAVEILASAIWCRDFILSKVNLTLVSEKVCATGHRGLGYKTSAQVLDLYPTPGSTLRGFPFPLALHGSRKRNLLRGWETRWLLPNCRINFRQLVTSLVIATAVIIPRVPCTTSACYQTFSCLALFWSNALGLSSFIRLKEIKVSPTIEQ